MKDTYQGFNELVDPLNKTLDTGKYFTRKLRPEDQNQVDLDRKAYQEGQASRDMEKYLKESRFESSPDDTHTEFQDFREFKKMKQGKPLNLGRKPQSVQDEVNSDYQDAPMSESQKGELAGTRSYNQLVGPSNKLMKTGEPLRRVHTPEANAQINADADAYYNRVSSAQPIPTPSTPLEQTINKNADPYISAFISKPQPQAQIQTPVKSNGSQNPYMDMIDQDRITGPGTEAQQGEEAGIRSYNQQVPSVNSLTKAGEPLRRVHSPEENARINEDAALYFNELNRSRNPQSVGPYEMGPAEKIVDEILSSTSKDTRNMPLTSLPTQANIPQGQTAPLVPMSVGGSSSNTTRLSMPAQSDLSPKNITEQELAQGSRDIIPAIGYQREVIAGEEADRIRKQGVGEQQAARAGTDLYQGQSKSLEDRIVEQRLIQQNAITQAEEVGKGIASQIDTNRVWKNTATWAKISLVVGAAIQGALGRDAGLQMIQKIAEEDIQAQMDDRAKGIIKHGNLLDLAAKSGATQANLLKQSNELAGKIIESFSKEIAAGTKVDTAAQLASASTVVQNTVKNAIDMAKGVQTEQAKASEQEEKRRYHEAQIKLGYYKASIDKMKAKSEVMNIKPHDQDIMMDVTELAQSAKAMKELENKKDFNPTTIGNAMKKVVAEGGSWIPAPGLLTPDESEYIANYNRYFSALVHKLSGAVAAPQELKRIALFTGGGGVARKGSLPMFQAMRNQTVNGMYVALNNEAKTVLLNTIPEIREFAKNRLEIQKEKLRGK